jgi:hypothetical protein
MRYLVTPSFSEKVARSSSQVLPGIGDALKTIETSDRDKLVSSIEAFLEKDVGIYVLKGPQFQILLSFGADILGEYALLVDLIVDGGLPMRPLPSRDPRQNMMIDPNRNMKIDPRRNMMIDPNRNMLIDPRRNMMIDPNRNMLIDPRRNMMIDPNRNIMIDPRRNPFIDPQRNWLIDPRRSTAWDGPYLHDLSGAVVGFVVRANDKVALLFDQDAVFVGPVIPAGDNYNLFDGVGRWTGFLVSNGAQGFNKFDGSGRWNAYVVGQILPKVAA